MNIIEHPSPNFDDRGGAPIDILLLHYTGMLSGAAAIARLCDRKARVSAHYVVEEDGRVLRLVDEAARAWHAGVSYWAGETNINARSIGVEIVNPGHEFGYRDFPAAQIDAVVELGKAILARHAIPTHRVLAHSDVAPQRKADPGEKFPWERLAAAGVGWWSRQLCVRPPAFQANGEGLGDALGVIGYDVGGSDRTSAAIRAFQRHYHPAAIGTPAEGRADDVTAEIAATLCRFVTSDRTHFGA